MGSGDNVYVIDYGNSRVQKFDAAGTFLDEWGSQGFGPGQFYYPNGIAVDQSGYVFVTDGTRVQKFGSDGTYVSSWGHEALLGVTADNDNVHVSYSYLIRKLSLELTPVTAWGSQGADCGQFNYALFLAVGPSGDIYVSDRDNRRIQVFGYGPTPTPSAVITPTITSVSPSGGARRGQVITIRGSSFGPGQNCVLGSVTFGEVDGGRTSTWSDTAILIPVPTNAPTGTQSIRVRSQGVWSNSVPYVIWP